MLVIFVIVFVLVHENAAELLTASNLACDVINWVSHTQWQRGLQTSVEHEQFLRPTSTDARWIIRNCSAYSEPMTSRALGGSAGSRRTPLRMRRGRNLVSITSIQKSDSVNRCVFAGGTICQMSSQSALKQGNIGLFSSGSLQQKEENKNSSKKKWAKIRVLLSVQCYV